MRHSSLVLLFLSSSFSPFLASPQFILLGLSGASGQAIFLALASKFPFNKSSSYGFSTPVFTSSYVPTHAIVDLQT